MKVSITLEITSNNPEHAANTLEIIGQAIKDGYIQAEYALPKSGMRYSFTVEQPAKEAK